MSYADFCLTKNFLPLTPLHCAALRSAPCAALIRTRMGQRPAPGGRTADPDGQYPDPATEHAMPSDPEPKAKRDGWSMRIWFGCDLFAWLRLLWLGRFRVGWRQARLLGTGTVLAAGHTFLRYAQEGLYGRRIREAVV